MKMHQDSFTLRASVMAVRGALITLAMLPVAYAADTTEAALTQQTSTVEVGATYVDKGSYKFGEYNGLEKKGGTANLGIDLKSGPAYDSSDATRLRIIGTDLGLETRDLSVEYGRQGKFRFNFGYDELLRNRSDSYMTPYQGAGSNFLTLPGSWLKPVVPQTNATQTSTNQNFRAFDPVNGAANGLTAGAAVVPNAATLATLASIQAADPFNNVNLYTKRSKYDVGFGYIIDSQWDVKASASHEHKNGYKPMGTVTSQISEFSATIPDLINQDHDQYNLSLNYKNDKSFLTFAYYGSLLKNNVSSMTWEDTNVAGSAPSVFATMSSVPSNQFHQFDLTGGYDLSKTTKLTAYGSYSRNTQNDSFLGAASAQNNQLAFGLPAASLNGLVVNKIFNLKLTSKPSTGLNLTGAYKYDDRDNRTAINTYLFQDANENKSGVSPFTSALQAGGVLPAGVLTALQTPGSNTNIYNNRAYSKKVNQLNLDADYAVVKGQAVKVGYDWQKIDRTCNGSWIDCADAATTKENTLRAEWRARATEDVSGKIGYAYSQRRVSNYNENAFLSLVPMANVLGSGGAATNGTTVATQSAYAYMLANGLTGFGPVAGFPAVPLTGNALIYSNNNGIIPQALYGSRNNINEIPGMRRFLVADRNRDKLRSSIDWQATEQLSFRGGLDLNYDNYGNSVYGLKEAKGWVLNLDGSYAMNESFSANVFYSYEDQRSKSAGDAYGSNNASTATTTAQLVSGASACGVNTVSDKNANAKLDPCLMWSQEQRDKVDTLGLALNKKGLMSGKLDLTGSLAVSQAKTDISVIGGSYVANPFLNVAGAATTTTAFLYIPAGALPTVTTNTVEFRLNGKYTIDKASAVRMGYSYTHMKSTDYAYNGMQFGSGTNYLPTGETAPNFTVQTIGASYLYSF